MATLIRFREPFREFAALHNEMNRLVSGLASGHGRPEQGWVPAADVWETDDELVYAFDLPGVSEDEISLEYDDGALTVSGRRERAEDVSRDERYYRFERQFGSFSRTIALPHGIAEDGVSAEYRDGVLQVHVRKPEQPKPRRIQIAGSGDNEQRTIEGSASQA